VQPRAKRTEVVGRHGAAIKIRLKAPPVDGAANDELVRFIAQRLGVARSAVTITAGVTGRAKRVVVTGVALAEAERHLLTPSPSQPPKA
jgi:uncharacterized protein (TIGR00251 family)